jgi:putative tryptophan/tyrosine transport system substrate-binding protein
MRLLSAEAGMRRREFLGVLGGAAAAWPLVARAQQQAMPVIGYVSVGPLKLAERTLACIRQGLAEYGYVEGQNFQFELRTANFQTDLVPILYRELVDQKVSLLIADWALKLEAARAATQSIPIVFCIGNDPVEDGFVASLNKPGGNITGIFGSVTLAGKRLEVFHELLPTVKTFAFLFYSANTTPPERQLKAIEPLQAAADSLGLSLLKVDFHTTDEFDAAFDTAVRGGAGGISVSGSIGFSKQLVASAARYRLPAIFGDEAAVKMGGLISYASDWDESFRVVGRYAGRILKGEKPADLPVQLATKTTMIINLKTAETLGITVPISLLARADLVIE